MKTLGNIIWFILGGVEMAIVYFLAGILYCCLIVTIPVGIQEFKLARFTLWPFGKKVEKTKPALYKSIINVIYFICGGFILVIFEFIIGVFYCITIIGIPFGRQHFKIAHFAVAPLGKSFVK